MLAAFLPSRRAPLCRHCRYYFVAVDTAAGRSLLPVPRPRSSATRSSFVAVDYVADSGESSPKHSALPSLCVSAVYCLAQACTVADGIRAIAVRVGADLWPSTVTRTRDAVTPAVAFRVRVSGLNEFVVQIIFLSGPGRSFSRIENHDLSENHDLKLGPAPVSFCGPQHQLCTPTVGLTLRMNLILIFK